MSIFKSLIAPVQKRILEKGKCPGCGRELKTQKLRDPLTSDSELVFCTCGRAYVFSRMQQRYRRALPEEIRSELPKSIKLPAITY